MSEVETLRRELAEKNEALIALEREKLRASLRAMLAAELIGRGFSPDAAAGIGQQLSERCDCRDGEVVMGNATGEAAVVDSYLATEGKWLAGLAKGGNSGGWDENRVSEPGYGSEWNAKDPVSYKAAFDKLVAKKAAIPPRKVDY